MQTLSELADEYLYSADLLSQQIASCNEKLRRARADGDAEIQYRLRTFLADLYTQRMHLREIAHLLKTYYDKPENCIH
ncbi:MAG: hypothetical protein IJT41_08015 [Clostridia bacterium]|nr:hypothetical protein [Clostridia bacterium]